MTLMRFLLILLFASLSSGGVMAQEQSAPVETKRQPAPESKSGAKAGRNKDLAQPFIVFGTIFTAQGFALPGADVRLRRAGERKDRWQGRSDSRGEFAFRVPPDVEYELSVKAKGFDPETRKVDARQGNRVDLTLRLQPASNQKKGKEKPS
jgi:hypothetical protein